MNAPKIGLYSADGPEYAGDLICGNLYDRLDEVIDDVDHAAEIVEPGDLVDYFAPLPTNIDKYSRGSVLIVAGSAQYPGAAIMAAKSAARAGAGYVAVAAPDACANLIRMALPSIPVFAIPSDSRGSFGAAARMTVCEIAKKYSCVLCGPGMTTSAGAMQVVSGLLELDVPLILDADALNCLAKIAIDGIDSNPEMYRREQPLVMTPHYRELSRLVAGDEVNDLGTAIAAAQKVVWGSLPRGRRRLSVALSVCCCRSRVRLLWQLPVQVMFSRVFWPARLPPCATRWIVGSCCIRTPSHFTATPVLPRRRSMVRRASSRPILST